MSISDSHGECPPPWRIRSMRLAGSPSWGPARQDAVATTVIRFKSGIPAIDQRGSAQPSHCTTAGITPAPDFPFSDRRRWPVPLIRNLTTVHVRNVHVAASACRPSLDGAATMQTLVRGAAQGEPVWWLARWRRIRPAAELRRVQLAPPHTGDGTASAGELSVLRGSMRPC